MSLIDTVNGIVMQHHSAYIEVAELLVDKDPLGAVDVYSKFPTAAVPTFDDAYIFGEIVRILFKLEAYDDPRLLSNMIAMGKVMGLGMIAVIPALSLSSVICCDPLMLLLKTHHVASCLVTMFEVI